MLKDCAYDPPAQNHFITLFLAMKNETGFLLETSLVESETAYCRAAFPTTRKVFPTRRSSSFRIIISGWAT
jgi:hypothetical protein